MATPKKLTRAEMEQRMKRMEADLIAMKREKELSVNQARPVLYLMRANKNDATYIVGASESLGTMPTPPINTQEDAEGVYYSTLNVGDDFSSLAAELERHLAPFKSATPDGSYEVSFEKGKMWLELVAGLATLKTMDDTPEYQELMREAFVLMMKVKKAKFGLSEETYKMLMGSDGSFDGSEAGDSVGATGVVGTVNSIKKEKDAKKANETKKIVSFVKECCVLDDKAPLISKDEVLGMYRIWAKGTTFYSNSLIIEHMRDELHLKVGHIGDSKNGILAFKGISLKMDDWKYAPEPGGPSVTRFLQEKCLFSPTEKTFSRNITTAYENWRKENGLGALHHTDLNRELRNELKACQLVCYAASITFGQESAAGWHGIGLIGEKDAIPTPTRKIASFKAGKVVERRMPGEGGEVLDSWPSLTQAIKALGIPMYRIQSRMRNAEPDDQGAILVFAADKNDGASTSNS